MSTRKFIQTISILLLVAILVIACGVQPEAEPQEAPQSDQPVPEVEEEKPAETEKEESPPPPPKPEEEPLKPSIWPEDPPESERTLEDSDSSLRSYENRVLSGDNFLDNLYERPFTSIEMVYQPDLDIYTVDFAYDDLFFYFTITLNGFNEDEGGLKGLYGIEFDLTLNGRGDLIVITENPQEEWMIINMVVLVDEDGDVGGIVPIIADQGFEGNGYDRRVELNEDKVAFSRISPENPLAIQIAVSRALLDNPDEFLWGAWADNGLKEFALFDYNDTMGQSEAGSPFRDNEDYPIDALYSVDNTCRLPYGFGQGSKSVPGICINVPPVVSGGGGCNKTCGIDWVLTADCTCVYIEN